MTAPKPATIYYDEMESPIGPLVVCVTSKGLCNIEFGRAADVLPGLAAWANRHYGQAAVLEKNEEAAAETIRQLKEYFDGKRKRFGLPLDLKGTPFQIRVWQALVEIPYGRTCSYKDIGTAIGNPKAVRAVGGANNKNPVAIVVPCHRVIGSNGGLIGYGGGLPIKSVLLRLEGIEPFSYTT